MSDERAVQEKQSDVSEYLLGDELNSFSKQQMQRSLPSDGSNSQSNASTNYRNISPLINSPTTSRVEAEVKLDIPQTGTTPLPVVPFPVSQAVPSSFETKKTSSAGFQTDREILAKEIWVPNHLTSDLTQQPNKSDSREDDLVLDRPNRTLTLKQLSVANVDEGLSPTHSSWPPSSSTPSPEYQKLFLVLDTNLFLVNWGRYVIQLKSWIQQQSPPDCVVFVIPWVALQELGDTKRNRYQKNKRLEKFRGLPEKARKAINVIYRWISNKDPGVMGENPMETTKKIGDRFKVENGDDQLLRCCLCFQEKYSNEQVAILTSDTKLRDRAVDLGLNAFTTETLDIWLRTNFPSFGSMPKKDREEEDSDDGSTSDDSADDDDDNGSSTESCPVNHTESNRPPSTDDFAESSGSKPYKRARFLNN